MSKKKEMDYMKPDSVILGLFGVIFRAVALVAIVAFLYRAISASYDYGYRIFAEPPMSSGEGRKITVTITKGMSAFEMGDLLEQKGLVRDGKLFGLQYYCSEYRKDVKPGTYELSTAMKAEEMLGVMAEKITASSEESEEAEGTESTSESDMELEPEE